MRAFPGNDERMSVLHQDSGGIGKSIPSALEISLGHGFCTPRPSGFPSGFALGKSLGSRGAKPMAAGNLSRFPSSLEIFLGLRPREILGVGDGFSNPSLLLVEHGYNPTKLEKEKKDQSEGGNLKVNLKRDSPLT